MDDCSLVPQKFLRQLDYIFIHNKIDNSYTCKNLMVKWAESMLNECRKDWEEARNITIDSLVICREKEKARLGAKIRDKRYASFREYFKNVQKEEYMKCYKQGKTLKAKNFAKWFLANKRDDIDIPYVPQNQLNKLEQLAYYNNIKFKNEL